MGEEAKQEQAKADTQPEPVAEEKKEEKAAEEEKKEQAKPPSAFVLFVDLHCVGCAKKIEKSIMRIRGVEGVTIDIAQNQVTIKGIVEPQAVCTKIMKKTRRTAKVLSPLPEAGGEPVPEVVTSQVSGLTTVELNVNMHCEACADQLKRKILKMRGVKTAETELSTKKVTVTGTMEANKLVDYVYRRTKKQAKIVPQPKPEPVPEPEKQEEKKEAEKKPPEEEAKPKEEEKLAEAAKNEESENNNKREEIKEEPKMEAGNNSNSNNFINNTDEENTKRMMYYYQPLYVIERIPPPQLFSDENPNACCIS